MNENIDIRALFNFSYGMYVIGSSNKGKNNAQVANAVMQVTSEPVCIAVCLNKQNLTEEFVCGCGAFSISVLQSEVPMPFIGRFGFKSGRDLDKFDGVDFEIGAALGTPMLKEWCLSSMELSLLHRMDMYTHTLFIGEVVAAHVYKEGMPLTYSDYHLLKKGKSPKTAPTYAFNALK